jgi:low molecular weight protein-tyrosine phosphatase
MITSDRPFDILIVCTANICRSPLAEHLLRAALAQESEDSLPRFRVSSAGIRGWVGAEMNASAAVELRRLGGDPTGFRSRDLTVAHCESADLILAAASEHRAFVLQECPRALKRTFTLLEFAHLASDVESVRRAAGNPTEVVGAASAARSSSSLADYDVMDPYGRSPQVYRAVADVIATAVVEVARALAQVAPTLRDRRYQRRFLAGASDE